MQEIKVILNFKTVWELLTKPICKKWSLEIYAEQYRIQCSFLVKVVRKKKPNEFSNESAKQPQLLTAPQTDLERHHQFYAWEIL